MAVLSEELRNLGHTLPLPDSTILATLFSHDLLAAYLQRSLLEALAAHGSSKTVANEGELERVARQVGVNHAEELDPWCRHHDIPLSSVQSLCSFKERLQNATETIWAADVPSRFLERRIQLDQAVLSVIRFKDADLAQELYFQMIDGELVFAQLLDRYANDPEQPPRGLVGPVSLEGLHPILARVAERYEPGALIPPLDINGTVHLIRVEKLDKATLDEAMRQRLLVELRQEWLNQQLGQLLNRLGASAIQSSNKPKTES